MATLSIAKPLQPHLPKSLLVDESWTRPAMPVVEAQNMEAAMRALAEAERVIQSQAEHIRQLENMALTDELTGLLNRRGFVMALHREMSLARRDATAGGVLVMVDLDGFKAINDMWGHSVGDDYLQAVAHALIGSVRSSDIVARLGGDEFAVLFTHMDEVNGTKRMQRLEKDFNSRMVQFGDQTLPLRASFGLAAYAGVDSAEAVLASADLKLYAHKAARKNR